MTGKRTTAPRTTPPYKPVCCPYGKTTDCQHGRCDVCVGLSVRDQFPDLEGHLTEADPKL